MVIARKDKIRDVTENLEWSLKSALDAARELKKLVARENPRLANEIDSYTISWIKSFLTDGDQMGSVKSIRSDL